MGDVPAHLESRYERDERPLPTPAISSPSLPAVRGCSAPQRCIRPPIRDRGAKIRFEVRISTGSAPIRPGISPVSGIRLGLQCGAVRSLPVPTHLEILEPGTGLQRTTAVRPPWPISSSSWKLRPSAPQACAIQDQTGNSAGEQQRKSSQLSSPWKLSTVSFQFSTVQYYY